MQSKKQSFIEQLIVALLSQILIFPLFDIHIDIADNLWIGLWFTVISVVRGYIVRRLFQSCK